MAPDTIFPMKFDGQNHLGFAIAAVPSVFIGSMQKDDGPIQRLLKIAKVREWNQLQSLWVPDKFLLGRFGQCRVMAGMRKSKTIVDEDGFWIQGHDGEHEYASVALGRAGLIGNLGQSN